MTNSLLAKKISNNVYWVGAIDNEIRDFHGYSTQRGTTYNAFLILGKKPILIDTVKKPFFEEMLARISSIIDPKKIAYIISNHAEMDHSGSLLPAIELFQPEKIFASKLGIAALKAHFNLPFELTEIANGTPFTLGDANLLCFETRMLHWPDSMFTYFANDQILFTQDGFGMHLATHKIFADQNERYILRYEAQKYFANILLPYANLVAKLIKQLPSLKLELSIIAPDHGPVWRKSDDIQWIIELWHQWSKQQPADKAVIVYDTMWQSTAQMANAIADGVAGENLTVKTMPLSVSHRSDVATELLEAGALLLGSPTINNQIFPTLSDILTYLKGLKRQNLIGQAFGSYGWSGEAIKLIQQELLEAKIKLSAEPIQARYIPTNENLAQCRKLGANIAQLLKPKTN